MLDRRGKDNLRIAPSFDFMAIFVRQTKKDMESNENKGIEIDLHLLGLITRAAALDAIIYDLEFPN